MRTADYLDEARRCYWHSLRGHPFYRKEFERQCWWNLMRYVGMLGPR